MMYEILFSNQFKRSYKKCLKRGSSGNNVKQSWY